MFATKQEYITIRYASFVHTKLNVVDMRKMMNDKDIRHAIKTCEWRHYALKGKDRSDRYVICRGLCTPCLRVIETGKCETLKELFEKESE